MKFNEGVDLFIADWQAASRINSKHTVAAYRFALDTLGELVGNRDPRTVGREDVKKALARWPHPNTQRARRAAYVAFFDWCMEEGYRKDNPARQTRRPKKRPTTVYRLTMEEVQALLSAASSQRERWVIYIGICAGLRNGELCGLQGRHFQRAGWIWVSKEIAKGGRERWVPVVPDLEPVWLEVHQTVPANEFVFAGRVWRNPGANTMQQATEKAISPHGVRHIVARVAKRAGIEAHVYPHLLRHAFGDHVARYAGIRNAQFMLGHANVGTTEIYTGQPTLDDLASAVGDLSFGLPPMKGLAQPVGMTERPLIDAIQFSAVLGRLRAELRPVAVALGEAE